MTRPLIKDGVVLKILSGGFVSCPVSSYESNGFCTENCAFYDEEAFNECYNSKIHPNYAFCNYNDVIRTIGVINYIDNKGNIKTQYQIECDAAKKAFEEAKELFLKDGQDLPDSSPPS